MSIQVIFSISTELSRMKMLILKNTNCKLATLSRRQKPMSRIKWSMIAISFLDQNFCSKYPVLFMIRICYMTARVHLCPLSYGNGQPELWKPKQINKIWSGANLNAALVNRVKPPIRHTNWLRLTCNSYLRNMTGLEWCHKKSFNRGKCSFAAAGVG